MGKQQNINYTPTIWEGVSCGVNIVIAAIVLFLAFAALELFLRIGW